MTTSALPSLCVPFLLFHLCCAPVPQSVDLPHIHRVEKRHGCLRGASWGREDKTIAEDALLGF